MESTVHAWHIYLQFYHSVWKMGQMTWTIWVTLLVVQVCLICKLNYLDAIWMLNRSHVLLKKTLTPDKHLVNLESPCWIIISVKPAYHTSSCFEECDAQSLVLISERRLSFLEVTEHASCKPPHYLRVLLCCSWDVSSELQVLQIPTYN